MTRISPITALIWILAPALCHAQDEATAGQLSVGVAFGASFPSGSGAAPGDPVYVFDHAAIRAAGSITASYIITSGLEVGFTVDTPEESSERAERMQRERIEAAYPDYLIESSRIMQQPSLRLLSLGISYCFRFGGLSVVLGGCFLF